MMDIEINGTWHRNVPDAVIDLIARQEIRISDLETGVRQYLTKCETAAVKSGKSGKSYKLQRDGAKVHLISLIEPIKQNQLFK